MGLVMAASEAADIFCPFSQCQNGNIQISLFFCMQLFNYTKTNFPRWAVQFSLKDLQFHNVDGVIPHNAPSKTFLCARSVILLLDPQKNIAWGKSTTMEDTDLAQGNRVSAKAWRFLHFCSDYANPDTTI